MNDEAQQISEVDSSDSKIVTKYLSDLISIRLDSPVQINTSKVSSKIFNCDQLFYIQTPKLMYTCEPGNKIKLFFENTKINQQKSDGVLEDFYVFFKEIEKQLRKKSNNIVSQILCLSNGDESTSTEQDLFYSSIETPSALHDSMSFTCDVDYTTFEVYDRKGKKFTEIDDFFKFKQGTFILLCECIHITPSRTIVKWKVIQGLVHPERIKKKINEANNSEKKKQSSSKFQIKKEEDHKTYNTNTPTIKFREPEEINVKLD